MLGMGSRLQLSNGTKIPVLGFGTWQISDSAATQAVATAIDCGYRHVDTAKIYGNERGVGQGVSESHIKREDIWVTSKLWPGDQFRSQHAFDASNSKLGLDYVDLYLVHWPLPGLTVRTWKEMEKIYQGGKCKAIGVSNHSKRQLKEILRVAEIVPMVNQIPFSPFGFDEELLNFCQENDIIVEAYSPLARGRKLNDDRLASIAKEYKKTPAQIMIRWALQKGTVVLPKSQTPERIKENTQVFDFEISASDTSKLDQLNGK